MHKPVNRFAKEYTRTLNRELRSRIREGTWPPGHVFTQFQITEEFSLEPWEVSEVLTPVLRKMHFDGLTELCPEEGGIVVRAGGESWRPAACYYSFPHDEYIEMVVRERLHRKHYLPGVKFTPLTGLAEEFGVSLWTVRDALRPLQDQGILVTHTNYTFVSHRLLYVPVGELLREPVRRRIGRKDELQAFGESRTMSDWSRDPRCQVNNKVLYSRYVMGWDFEKALTTPIIRRGKASKQGNSSESDYPDTCFTARTLILQRIKDGTYPRGGIIPCEDIAFKEGIDDEGMISALRDLQSMGIVDHRKSTGYFVKGSRRSHG
ncbi:GntR family transcriptional regulator [Streptomyces sp. NPDC059631]|uniref:GntR family transcriptional regulator n=1 Tax=unclassified Streptomyces TaxID=2593676 RepID=UPI0036B7ABC4